MYKLNIKKVRVDKNITQSRLSKDSGISQSFISELEKSGWNRIKGCRLETIESLAKGLGCCPMELLLYDCEFCYLVTDKKKKILCRKCVYKKLSDGLNYILSQDEKKLSEIEREVKEKIIIE